MAKPFELTIGKDSFGDAFYDVIVEGKRIGTIWESEEDGRSFVVEAAITGMCWGCDTFQEAVSILFDVNEENKK